MILLGQSPAPMSDALPRRTYYMESDEDSEVERMTKRAQPAVQGGEGWR